MPPHRSVRLGAAILSLLLFTATIGVAPRASAADEEIKCASCGKKIKKKDAIKVIKDGKVYYVCSTECAKKIKK